MNIRRGILNLFRKHCAKCDGMCCKKAEFTVFNSELIKLPQSDASLIFRKKFGENIARISMGKKCPYLMLETGCTLTIDIRPLDCLSYPVYPIVKYGRKGGMSCCGMMVHLSCPFAVEISNDEKIILALNSFWEIELQKIDKNDLKCWFGNKRNYWLDKNVIKVEKAGGN